jgi:hypothetical protein
MLLREVQVTFGKAAVCWVRLPLCDMILGLLLCTVTRAVLR